MVINMKRLLLLALLATACKGGVTHHMFIVYGQSIGLGNWACPEISTSQPYSNTELNVGLTAFRALDETGLGAAQAGACIGGLAWGGSDAYVTGAVVTNGGSAYIAVAPSTGVTPGTDMTKWVLVTSQEAMGSSAANNITLLDATHAFSSIVNNFSVGGQPIASFQRGTSPYNAVLAAVTAAQGLLSGGDTLEVDGVMFVEGESDFIAGSLTYKADSVLLQSNMQEDIQAITLQIVPIPYFIPQLSSMESVPSGPNLSTCPDTTVACIDDPKGTSTPGVPMSQWQLQRDYPGLFYTVGPRYQYTYPDGALHQDNISNNKMGATAARILYELYVRGNYASAISGVYPKQIIRVGANVTVTTFTPNGLALALDTTTVPDPFRNGATDSNGKGFQFFCNNGGTVTEIGLSGPITISGTTITLPLASTPSCSTSERVVYGFEGQRFAASPSQNCSFTTTLCNGQAVFPSRGIAHGNLRTATDYTDLNGDAIQHWMVAFNEPVGYGQASIYEDWNCYTFTAAASVAGGKTNFTCNKPHGWPVGTTLIVWGATGMWSGLNTRLDQTISNEEAVGSTDLDMLVNDTSKIIPGSLIEWTVAGPITEVACVDHVNANYLFFGTSCTSGTPSATGRGWNGSTQVVVPQSYAGGITANLDHQDHWSVTIIDDTTIQVAFDSSAAGSFAGQVVHVSRSPSGDPPAPLVRPYYGQPWAPIYDVTANGLEITIPLGTNCTTDPYTCSRGFLPGITSKGQYNYYTIQVGSIVFSGTFPNQTATVTFTSPFINHPNNAVLTPASSAVDGLGALVYIYDFDETSTGTSFLNHVYLVNTIITDGMGNITGATLIPGGRRNVPNGTYSSPVGGGTVCNGAAGSPCLVMPWTGDGYMDTQINNYHYNTTTLHNYNKTNGALWNPLSNRFDVMIKYTGINRSGVCRNELGTYVAMGTDPTDNAHFYHDTCANIVSGVQTKMEYTSTSAHIVGSSSQFADDPAYSTPGWLSNPAWRGGQYHYYDGMFRIYLDNSSGDPMVTTMAGSVMTIRSMSWNYAQNEPEEYVQGRTSLYDGAKYQFGWRSPIQLFGASYDVKYDLATSNASSCVTDAFSSGASAGSVTIPNGSSPSSGSYNTANMAQQSLECLYLRPYVSVYAASPNGQNPIWLWSYQNSGMQPGDKVTSTGVGGSGNVTNTALSGVQWRQRWSVLEAQTDQPWTIPGTMVSIASNGSGVCTVTTTTPHHLAVGWPFTVYFPPATPALFSTQDIIDFTVATVPSSTTWTFTCPMSAVANTTWNTDQGTLAHFGIESYPGVSLAGTASSISLSNGTFVSTEDTKNFAVISIEAQAGPPSPSGGSVSGGKMSAGGKVLQH